MKYVAIERQHDISHLFNWFTLKIKFTFELNTLSLYWFVKNQCLCALIRSLQPCMSRNTLTYLKLHQFNKKHVISFINTLRVHVVFKQNLC